MSNYYPSIPDPQNNTESLADTARALKMAVETLAGQRDGGAATRVFEQADEPKGPRVGDTWVETQDAGRIRIWNGQFWVDISDSRFSILEKTSANASAMIKELSTVRVTDTEAFAQKITELEAKFNSNTARIYEELTVRATAEEALAQRISNLTATISLSDYTVTAAVSDERIARVNADGAIASAITTASVGAARVYVQDEPPTASGRLQGDVWYDSDASYKPYYWNIVSGSGSWVDNSAGTYKIGQVAAISQSLTATQDKVNNTLGVQWAVQATIDGSTGGVKFTGVKKADGTGATYDLVIQANTKIYGDLIVTGSITANGIGLNQISDNQSNVAINTNSAAVYNMSLTAGDRVTIIGTGAGNATAGGVGGTATMTVYYQGPSGGPAAVGSSQTITALCESGTLGYTGTTYFWVGSYKFPPGTIVRTFTASSTGLHNFSVTQTMGGDTGIIVLRLSR